MFAASLALRVHFDPLLGGLPFITFYPAIAAGTLICGWRAGAVVLVLSALSTWYLFLEPVNSFAVRDPKTVVALAGFLLVGGFILVLVAALREVIRRIEIAKAVQENLFSELQHRVANNLQLVVSLLRNAQRNLRNPVLAAEALNDAEGRVMAMSQLHRQLYDGTAFADGLEPLLKEMLADAFRGLPVVVKVSLQGAEELSIGQITAMALLVNEAALNAAKHAFCKGRGTHFDVLFSKKQKGGYRLQIEDDGPGMEAEVVDAQTRSLGMKIMQSFANQLGGPLQISGEGGTSLIVDFGALSSAETEGDIEAAAPRWAGART